MSNAKSEILDLIEKHYEGTPIGETLSLMRVAAKASSSMIFVTCVAHEKLDEFGDIVQPVMTKIGHWMNERVEAYVDGRSSTPLDKKKLLKDIIFETRNLTEDALGVTRSEVKKNGK